MCKRLINIIQIFNTLIFKIRHEFEYDQSHLFFFLYSQV